MNQNNTSLTITDTYQVPAVDDESYDANRTGGAPNWQTIVQQVSEGVETGDKVQLNSNVVAKSYE